MGPCGLGMHDPVNTSAGSGGRGPAEVISSVRFARVDPVPDGAHRGPAHLEDPGRGADRPAVVQETPDSLHFLR